MTPRLLHSTPADTNRKKAFSDGDSVPIPLGFTAFPPEWLFPLGRLAPPRHSGRWVGAPVASLRCRILRPGGASINHATAPEKIQMQKIQMQKSLPERSKVG
jgi:hypothetical protein